MATNVGGVTLDTSVLDKLTAEMKPNANKIVAKYAFAIQGDAQTNSPVDTGALRASIEAEETGDLSWQVHDGVAYGVFQELGTSKMAAHPFLVPAVEKFRDRFLNAFSELFK